MDIREIGYQVRDVHGRCNRSVHGLMLRLAKLLGDLADERHPRVPAGRRYARNDGIRPVMLWQAVLSNLSTRSKTRGNHGSVMGIDLGHKPEPLQFFGGERSRAGATERVDYELTGLGQQFDKERW
jgi:hypothetical protein